MVKSFQSLFWLAPEMHFFNEEMLEVPNLEEEIYRFREESLIIRWHYFVLKSSAAKETIVLIFFKELNSFRVP